MKLVIFGANGRTGRQLVKEALEAGHEVIAYVRKAGDLKTDEANLKVIVGSLEDFTKLLDVVSDADACFSTLGGRSLSKRSTDFTRGIDNIVTVMKQAGVDRFIYLSSIGAGDSRFYMGPLIRLFVVWILLRIPLTDHTLNENRIAKSNLKWTFVRPLALSNGEKAGTVRHGTDFIKITRNAPITRADVASFMLRLAVDGIYIRRKAWLLASS